MRRRFTPELTTAERVQLDKDYNLVIQLVISRVRFLPEEHKADIRKLMEELDLS